MSRPVPEMVSGMGERMGFFEETMNRVIGRGALQKLPLIAERSRTGHRAPGGETKTKAR